MTNTQKDTECNAFVHGYNVIREREQGVIVARWVMREISHALKQGGLSGKAFYNRKYGFVNHRPTEREKIEEIFTKYGVPEPWGLE